MAMIKPFTTEYDIRGHKYVITADAKFDDNGKIVADKKLDDLALNKAYDAFRKDQKYIYPQEIRKFRHKLGFTQKDLANLLGMSPNTIALYELGALPSEANNKLLKLIINDDDNLRKMAQGKDISERVKEKVNNYLNGDVIVSPDSHDVTSPFNATQLANWLIIKHNLDAEHDQNVEPLTQMKIIKLLYFAYGIFLARTRNKLFDSEIRHYQWGPLIMDVHKHLNGQTIINERNINNKTYEDFINVSANKNIAALLEYVYKKYGKYTASYLSSITHRKNSPWSKTPNHEIISDDLIYDSFSKHQEM